MEMRKAVHCLKWLYQVTLLTARRISSMCENITVCIAIPCHTDVPSQLDVSKMSYPRQTYGMNGREIMGDFVFFKDLWTTTKFCK